MSEALSVARGLQKNLGWGFVEALAFVRASPGFQPDARCGTCKGPRLNHGQDHVFDFDGHHVGGRSETD